MKDENTTPSELETTAGHGFLAASLGRSNKQIREERGNAIAEDLQIVYKRKVEDLEIDVRRALRVQQNAFDFSPTNSQSLVMAKELESVDILEADLKTSLDIRNLKVKLNHAKSRYNVLFGDTYELEPNL
jgi:hypothetical protein